MITIADLIDICHQIEEEFGTDGNVIFQLRDEAGEFLKGDYVYAMTCDSEGRLYLTNNPPTIGNYTS